MSQKIIENNKTVLITGATSGIGFATAHRFASSGEWNVVVTGRRIDRLLNLENDLLEKYKANSFSVKKLCFDVRDKEEVFKALSSLEDDDIKVSLLINNAGLARGFDRFEAALLSDWEEMIDANLKGLLYVSKAIVPQMIGNGGGHIINIGSTAAKEVYLNGNVYCATKHAVDAITRGMRMDLLEKNIRVAAIHPGFVETEFSIVRFHGDTEKAKSVYEGFTPLSGADVAEVIYFMANQPPHVHIGDLVLLPTAQASVNLTKRNLGTKSL